MLLASLLAIAFSGSIINEFSTGYLASGGSLLDTRPVAMQEIDGDIDLGEFGYITGYGWFISALHDSQHAVHREPFFEFEGAIMYGKQLSISKQFSVKTEMGSLWNPQIGNPSDDANYWGPILIQSLENPYLVPYYNALFLVEPHLRGRIRMGVRRRFAVTDSISLTPSIEAVWSERHRYKAKFGGEPENFEILGGGFGSEKADLRFNWQITDSWALTARLTQFMVIGHQARSAVRASTKYYAKTFRILARVGVEYSF